MDYNYITNIGACYVDIPHLLYYSHIPTAIIVLLVGFFVLYKGKTNRLAGKLLFLIAILFSLWVLVEGTIWFVHSSMIMMFLWSFLSIFYVLIHFLSLYFVYVFVDEKDISSKKKYILGALLLPVLILSLTKYNLVEFDIANCQPVEGVYFMGYKYFLGLLSIGWIIGLLVSRYKKADEMMKNQIKLLSFGILSFLLLFSWSEMAGSVTQNFEITQYGLFGMPVFISFLVYLIVKYDKFNTKLLTAQALVVGLIIVTGSQFAFIQNPMSKFLVALTLIMVSIFGWWLVKSVEREFKQKEELRIANIELMKLDQAKSDFINIASHQLRTPISVIQGVASMLLDGDIDKMPQEERQRFYEAVWIKSKKLQTIINDILNASKIDNKVSEMDQVEDVDIPEILKKVTSDFNLEAKERDIVLVLDVPKKPISIITGQKKYLEEVFVNLINNAIKYTPSSVMTNDVRKVRSVKGKAKVAVKVREDKEKGLIMIEVKDNGIGIPEKSAHSLFKKFARADNAVKMYTDGSGLGLYIVREVIEDHGGRVWFESKVNIGTTFFVELPTKTKKVSDVRRRILGEK